MQRTTRLKKPQVPEPGELINFDDIVGRPKYAGEEMTSETNIPSVTAEAEARAAADQELWTEIETIEAASDVVDVVGTYAELEAYDTSKLHDKDLIKVLQDETRDDAITYYRYSTTTEAFSYVGAEGPYYTASETDVLLSGKQDTIIAGSNVQIASDGKTISATDTTYSDFVGATTLVNGEAGLVPAPLSTDVAKFLQGDGSWGTPTDTTYTAGTNVQISNQNVISATDTTYSNFTGTDGSVAGAAGLVPAPAITDAGKYLKADGTWDTVQTGSTDHVQVYLQFYSAAGQSGYKMFSDSSYTEPLSLNDAYNLITSGKTLFVTEGTRTKFFSMCARSNGSPSGNYKFYFFSPFGTSPELDDERSNFTQLTGYPTNSDGTGNVVVRSTPSAYTAGQGISISGGVISTTGGDALTQFYYEANDNMIYKDISLTEPATFMDVLTAYNSGAVRIGNETVVMVRPYFAVAAGGDFVRTYEYTEYPAAAWTLADVYLQPSLTAGSNISISAQNVISASMPSANASTAGIGKLYTTTGQNTDGAVTQKLFTDTVGNIETALQILNHGAGV